MKLHHKKINQFCQLGKDVIEIEAKEVKSLAEQIDKNFAYACQYLLDCKGRVIVLGMGKSGHIGNKIAATLASTGTPAFFIHPAEAGHGDMGMITSQDTILAISYSGETPEILLLLPLFKRLGLPIISITGNSNSSLSRVADINLSIQIGKEACPLSLAPSSSTTVTLALGDALAITLLQAKGFTSKDFAFSHPGGSLGKKLLLRVGDIMSQGHDLPLVSPDKILSEALIEITQKRLGVAIIVDEKKHLLGIFTDGDLRRTVEQEIDHHQVKLRDIMTKNPRTILAEALATEALQNMQLFKITSLIVVNEKNEVRGLIHLHKLLESGII